MRMKTLVAAALVTTAALTGTAAQAQSSDTLQTFSREDFKAALAAIGATTTDIDGGRNIDIVFEGEIYADGLLLACDNDETETNCYGSSILATFEPDDSTTDAQITEAVNTYNYNENFGRAYVDPDGVISVRMYIISDGGIKRENYQAQLALFAGSLSNFFTYLYPE